MYYQYEMGRYTVIILLHTVVSLSPTKIEMNYLIILFEQLHCVISRIVLYYCVDPSIKIQPAGSRDYERSVKIIVGTVSSAVVTAVIIVVIFCLYRHKRIRQAGEAILHLNQMLLHVLSFV